jgi:hypothetical protein
MLRYQGAPHRAGPSSTRTFPAADDCLAERSADRDVVRELDAILAPPSVEIQVVGVRPLALAHVLAHLAVPYPPLDPLS